MINLTLKSIVGFSLDSEEMALMKVFFILIFISYFNYSNELNSQSCPQILKQIISPSLEGYFDQKLVEFSKRQLANKAPLAHIEKLSDNLKDSFRRNIQGLTESDLAIFFSYLNMQTLPERQIHIANELARFKLGHEGEVFQDLNRHLKRASLLYDVMYRKMMDRENFLKHYFACQARVDNNETNQARDLYDRFSVILSLSFTGLGYVWHNSDKPKDSRWYGELAYDLVYSFMLNRLNVKIATKVQWSYGTKSKIHFLTNRGANAVDLLVFPTLFPDKNYAGAQKIEMLKNDPQFKSKILELEKSFDELNVLDHFRQNVLNNVLRLIMLKQPIFIDQVDWSVLKPEDLKREDVQLALTLATVRELYKLEASKHLFTTEDMGIDRFIFGSGISLFLTPIYMLKASVNYQILCLGQSQPYRAFLQSAAWSASLTFLTQLVFYNSRKVFINQ